MIAGITTLLVALSISLLVTRVAAMALMFTGLSREAARFQARSAFSGVGYTTSEAENIVNHPVRRRIVALLMLLGNIGIATVIASIMLSVSSSVEATAKARLLTLAYCLAGFTLLFYLSSSRWVERQLNKIIAWSLKKFTDLDVRDYHSLLQLADGFAVTEFAVDPKHWITGGKLKELRLSDEGILVLGIHRNQSVYTGIPRANDTVEPGDTLILYGSLENIRSLQTRRPGQAGDTDHRKSVERQFQLEAARRDESGAADSTEAKTTDASSKPQTET